MLTTKQSSPSEENAKGKSNAPFFSKHFVQAKLQVNEPGDSYEREADAMADRVMSSGSNSTMQNSFFKPAVNGIQRKCQHCEDEEKMLHRKESSGAEVPGGDHLDNYVSSLGSSGTPLPEASRKFFEPRFGQDFSNVRIHNDSVAAKSAQSINALAYTNGNNIVFNQGQYSPDNDSGKKLMAHELTHVVQQKPQTVMKRPHAGHAAHPSAHLNSCKGPSIRNQNYPNTFIDHVDVDLSSLRLLVHWNNPPVGSYSSSSAIAPGAGICCNNCNDVAESKRADHGCSPIVQNAPVTRNNTCNLGGHPTAKFPTYFSRSSIAIHSGVELGHARSHGCVRTEHNMAQIIQENSKVTDTKITVHGAIPTQDKCYIDINDKNSVERSHHCHRHKGGGSIAPTPANPAPPQTNA